MDSTLLKLKALADRNRLRIVAALLNHAELCHCQINELLQVSGATSSRHLSQLQQAGIVSSRKDGRWTFFCVEPKLRETPSIQWLEKELELSEDVAADRDRLQEILKELPEEICRRQRNDNNTSI